MDKLAKTILAAMRQSDDEPSPREAALLAHLSQEFESLTDFGWWCVNCETDELTWSSGTYRVHGLDPGAPMTVAQALLFYDVFERERIAAIVAEALETRSGFTFDSTIVTAEGLPRRVRSNGLIRVLGGVQFLLGTFQDISAFFDESLTARWVSHRDSLTALANRRALYELAPHALESGSGTLALVDVDSLKAINDVFGHAAGDCAIQAIGNALRDGFPLGCVARIGGDEFCVLLEGCTPDDTARAFAPIIDHLHKSAIANAECIALGGSVGITGYRRGEDLQAVLKRADRAMYVSKHSRRGGVTVFTSELRDEAERRDHSVSIVRNAIERSAIVTYFQPIVDVTEGAIKGFEALLRCERGRGRPIKVDLATAFADSNLSRAILPRVVADSCAFSATVGRPVNVNATFFDVVGTDFFDILEHNRLAHGLPRDRLCIEVTETAILSDRTNLFLQRIRSLADAGYPIILDDFGTGYSSLTHLRDLAVTRIKLDKSFVEQLSDPRDSILVQGLIDLCGSMGVGVVAEGVETRGDAEALLGLGCTLMQGYFFGRPAPAWAFTESIARPAWRIVGDKSGSFQRGQNPYQVQSKLALSGSLA